MAHDSLENFALNPIWKRLNFLIPSVFPKDLKLQECRAQNSQVAFWVVASPVFEQAKRSTTLSSSFLYLNGCFFRLTTGPLVVV